MTPPTTPPDGVLPPERSPHAPAPGSELPSHYRWCFSCGVDHPAGLHMRVTAGEGLTVTSWLTLRENHQGAPGLAHGGLLATALDETLGALNYLLAAPAVTGRLETDFRRPVPIGSTLRIDAEIVGAQGRKVWTRASGRLGDLGGPVAVEAAALFIQVPIQHFLDNGEPEILQRAIEDRAKGAPSWDAEVNP